MRFVYPEKRIKYHGKIAPKHILKSGILTISIQEGNMYLDRGSSFSFANIYTLTKNRVEHCVPPRSITTCEKLAIRLQDAMML